MTYVYLGALCFWLGYFSAGPKVPTAPSPRPLPPSTPDLEADVNDYKVPDGFMKGREHIAYRVEADSDREAAHKFWEWYCT